MQGLGDLSMDNSRVKYNTNLASEFWVLSALYRCGIDAQLTLGNKKGVDIIIPREAAEMITVEVKGLAKKYDWHADNIQILNNPKHFYVFLSFDGEISNPLVSPSVWIIPSNKLEPFIKKYPKATDVSRSLILKNGDRFKNAWHLLSAA